MRDPEIPDVNQQRKTIALIGNPNVGKSSIFNALTGMHQHTGNWPGKTIAVAKGHFVYDHVFYEMIDLPGTYSLEACSEEEMITRDFILSGQPDCIVVVGDATCLERNLYLLFQVLSRSERVIFCVNLLDEAQRKGLSIHLEKLQQRLGIPVVGTAATSGLGLSQLKTAISAAALSTAAGQSNGLPVVPRKGDQKQIRALSELAHAICQEAVTGQKSNRLSHFDRLALGRWSGRLLMLILLMGVFWITIKGANYPSAILQALFSSVKGQLIAWMAPCPPWLRGILLDGIYDTSAKVIAVMLPPMAIFFPLFTLLEDIGYLPRIALMMDHAFERCGSCGKQSLTMAMGFGCNAAGVVGCRIISSARERLIAILTNSLVPCNGRFPALIVLISIFFSKDSFRGACLLTGFVIFSVLMTFLASSFLSKTVLKGEETHFILEVPPYRRPKVVRILIRALVDRTLHVLGRAVLVAAPVGALIWFLQNFQFHGELLITCFTRLLDPIGVFFGLNGIILLTFILSFPANELVLPLLVMLTQGAAGAFEVENAAVEAVLLSGGWDLQLGLATIVFLLFHWPCSTTCLTILKETKSWKWTLLSILLPTCIGLTLCFLIGRF